MPNRWTPIPIEKYFKDDPDRLLMWQALGVKEEKQVPWYGDEPIAKSDKVDMTGVYRTNFNPRKKLMHLHLVAEATGIETLPVDMDKAVKKIVRHLKKKNEG